MSVEQDIWDGESLDIIKRQPWEQEGCVFKKCCKKYKKKGKKRCKSCPDR